MRSSAPTGFDSVAHHRGSSQITTSAASVTAPSPATMGMTLARREGCGSTRIVVQRDAGAGVVIAARNAARVADT